MMMVWGKMMISRKKFSLLLQMKQRQLHHIICFIFLKENLENILVFKVLSKLKNQSQLLKIIQAGYPMK